MFYANDKLYFSTEEFIRDTFSPESPQAVAIDFTVHGRDYQERKAYAKGLAIDWSHIAGEVNPSMYELSVIQSRFETLGKRYGLLEEFRENCIC